MINEAKLKINATLQSTLNTDVWDGEKLRPDVRKALIAIADTFEESLEDSDIEVKDVILTGSLANYNWTKHSDLDVHLVVDLVDSDNKRSLIDIQDYLNTKRQLWSERHPIKVKGYPVELYAQLADETLTATAVYSLTLNKWILKPNKDKFDVTKVNKEEAKKKADQFKQEIDDLIKSDTTNIKVIDKLKDRIWEMRKAGLDKHGEFSTENVAFKALRNAGDLERLLKYRVKAINRALTVNSAT